MINSATPTAQEIAQVLIAGERDRQEVAQFSASYQMLTWLPHIGPNAPSSSTSWMPVSSSSATSSV